MVGLGGKRTMKRLSILALILIGGCAPREQPLTNTIPRPSPDDATPTGIAYLCDGRKEVSVVYAKNRASVSMGDRTWRLEYQASAQGFRYLSSSTEWTGRDDLATLKETGGHPLAFNCRPTRRTA
jgi:membrane-bound inhibitor of C-type lysozyme